MNNPPDSPGGTQPSQGKKAMSESYHFLRNLRLGMACYDLSVYKLAKDTQRTPSTYSRYLQKNDSTRLPRNSIIKDVARYFGVSADAMVNRELSESEISLNPLPEDYEKQVALINSVPLYTAADLMIIQRGGSVEVRHFLSAPPVRRHRQYSSLFAYDVLGNEFQPLIRHGDITFCSRYDNNLSIRDGALVLVCMEHLDTQLRTVMFAHLTYGISGEKMVTYGSEHIHKVPVRDEEILGVVIVNCSEFV